MNYELTIQKLREQLVRCLNESGEISDEEIQEKIEELMIADGCTSCMKIAERMKMQDELFSSVRRLGMLQELLDDDEVTEIMVNGPKCIFYEKRGRIVRWSKDFGSIERLEDLIRQIVGSCNRVVTERSPIVDARLSDGSRVNAVIAPVALNGPILTIRKFPKEAITMNRLLQYGTITKEAADFLQRAVAAGYSIVIGGGTSAGKTTFLNALSSYIPHDERIITIEDNAELQIQGIPNLVKLEAKQANMEGASEVTIRDLIKSALRMRPDRIIVGEVRGGEAVDMLQAFNTGHDGSLCTIHANSCEDMLSRLEMMVLMAFPLPLPAIRRQITSGVDLLVHLGRLKDHRRRVLEISEVDGMNEGEVRLHPLYRWEEAKGCLQEQGKLIHTLKMERYAPQPSMPQRASL